MQTKSFSLIWAVALAALLASADEIPVRVVRDRVNLRAKPSLQGEVVLQAHEGAALLARQVGAEWVEVRPPRETDLWVHRDFVKGDRVTGSRVNVRAGPGINYSIVATLDRDTQMSTRGDFGDWVKVAPPESASLWVSREMVEVVRPEPPPPAPPPVVPPAVVQETRLPSGAENQRGVQPAPRPLATQAARERAPTPPSDVTLVPLPGQGHRVEITGVLRTTGLMLHRPAPFRLVRETGSQIETLCFIRGNTAQLKAFLGRRLSVRGPQFWIQGVRPPLIMPEQLVVED